MRDDRRLFRQFRTVFRAMLRDEPQDPLALPSAGRGLRTDVAPSRGTDRLVRRLSLVRCRGAADGTGWRGRTVLRVSMHAWNGERGVALARRVAELRAAGLQRAGARGRRLRPAGPRDPEPGARCRCGRPGCRPGTPTRS